MFPMFDPNLVQNDFLYGYGGSIFHSEFNNNFDIVDVDAFFGNFIKVRKVNLSYLTLDHLLYITLANIFL
jgi:hypothetical protein